MNDSYEYEQFWAKFLKNAQELQNDFDRLSEENKRFVAQRISTLLRGCGLLLAAEDVLRYCVK